MASDITRPASAIPVRTKEDFQMNYEVLEKIGRGSFGTIRKVRHRTTGQILARKEISYSAMSQRERDQLTAEIKVLEKLQHPNIVKYQNRHHISETRELHLYMEYCSNGDLGGHIKRLIREHRFAEEDFVWSIFAQLISALFLCHTGGTAPPAGQESVLNKPKIAAALQRKDENHIILHRDLKPENVFLTNGSTVKLGDFGLSRVLQAHDFASTYVGTPFYMSPELCSSERYSSKSDIWSLGCIMYELCAQEPPFNGRSHLELIHNIRGGNLKELPVSYSKSLRDLVRRCLKVSQDDRPDVAQLLQEPMIKVARMKLHLDLEKESWADKLAQAEKENVALKAENAKLRDAEKQIEMQWHAKATLAIAQRVDERVEAEKARLWKILEEEKARLTKNLETELSKRPKDDVEPDLSTLSLSVESSPLAQRVKPRRPTRAPFTRAKTFANFPGSPMDISPSKENRLPAALTPSRKAPQAPRSPLRGRTLIQLAQSPAKWGPELGDDMPSPFLRKGRQFV